MARKTYSDEFRRQAVELYESTPGATVKGIAEDLGIERTTLWLWLDRLGSSNRPSGLEREAAVRVAGGGAFLVLRVEGHRPCASRPRSR